MRRAYANRCGLFLTQQKRLWEYYITSCVSALLHSWQGPCCTLHDITLHTSDCTLSSLHLCMFSSPFYPPEHFPQLFASLPCQSDSSVWLFLHRKSRRNTRFINRSLVFIFGGSAALSRSVSFCFCVIHFLGLVSILDARHTVNSLPSLCIYTFIPPPDDLFPIADMSQLESGNEMLNVWFRSWDDCFGWFIICQRHQIILFLLKRTFMYSS